MQQLLLAIVVGYIMSNSPYHKCLIEQGKQACDEQYPEIAKCLALSDMTDLSIQQCIDEVTYEND